MQYKSTRGSEQVRSTQAILNGLAPDGGLYMPVRFPDDHSSPGGFDWRSMMGLPFTEMAVRIFSLFLDDLKDIPALVRRAYEGKFDCEDITPLVPVGDRYVLELFHGPTCAFKDVALSALPVLMTAAQKQEGSKDDILILTATSGDTGKAAMEGFKDVSGIRIIVFYPEGGVSPVQERQMTTQEGGNVQAIAVRGNFDDAQNGVKSVFTRVQQEGLPKGCHTVLSSANSINIGRLVPQIVYYFKAYSDLLALGRIRIGDPVVFTVPTGNFGDILAGFFAMQLGLPIARLLCASNANNVLTDFFNTGVYDRNRPFYKTTSPSMDILISSNLERLLYLGCGQDETAVRLLMNCLSKSGVYRISPLMLESQQQVFAAGFADDDTVAGTIAAVFNEHRYLMDPHTAVAWSVADQLADALPKDVPNVVLSTASPYKFPQAVLSALCAELPADPFDMMDRLQQISGVPVPAALAGLKERPVRFSEVIDRDHMFDRVMEEIL